MTTPLQSQSWLRKWFGADRPREADALEALLTQICRQEIALAFHLADRARALRFAPHRRSLEALSARESQNAEALAQEMGSGTTLAAAASPARRPGTLTATKLIRDLEETEELSVLYRQASRLASDGILRGKLGELSAAAARGSQTIRGVLAGMDSYVTDLP